jgi:hypothetical protein
LSQTQWKSYEDVARYLISQFRQHFELGDVEGKQKVRGLRSGTDWEIDAKGKKTGDSEMFVIVECRRHTSAGQKQEHLAGLAYRIIDTGASGGIIVSPIPLQKGARRVAQAEGIIQVTLTKDSTTTDYVMQFLNKVMIATSDTICVHDSVRVVLRDAHGRVKFDDVCD